MQRKRKKLSLRPEELQVDSFPIDGAPPAFRGTVAAHQQRPTFAATCPQSCQPGCAPPTEDPDFCAVPTTTLPSAQVDFQTNCV